MLGLLLYCDHIVPTIKRSKCNCVIWFSWPLAATNPIISTNSNVSKMNIILDLTKDSKLTIIFNLFKVSKITSLRISISPVMEGRQHQTWIAGALTYVLWKWCPHTCSGTPHIGCFRVDDEVWILINYSLSQADIENSYLHSWNFYATLIFTHLFSHI